MDDRVVTYAQNREDVILAAFFSGEEKGFYVDVGAYHPVEDSVTKYFYERGWRGINIEPNNHFYKQLVSDRPEDINLNVGVADKPGKMHLRIYEHGEGLSTFSEDMKKDYETHLSGITETYRDEEVKVATLEAIFKEHKIKSIQFMKVDIEGYEYNALAGNDWGTYRPEVLCIEANHILRDWRPILSKNNYVKVFFDGLNEYYVAQEAKRRADNFSYVQGLLGRPIISHELDQQLRSLDAAKKRLELELESEKSKEWETRRELAHMHAELRQQRRIRNLAKTLLKTLDTAVLGEIERLNTHKRKHASKLIPVSEQAIQDAKGSRSKLLNIAQENDLESFYTNSASGDYSRAYLYKFVLFSYKTLRWPFKFTLKILGKAYRLIKAK